MNILLLGNGYDLNYKLPTSYRNFLLTLDFLIKNDLNNINNIGDVFGNHKLNNQDCFIKSSYEKYKDVYDNIQLDKEILQKMVEKTKNNVWFSYLINSFNKDVGWIDFEKEIAFVIECFQYFFKKVHCFKNTDGALFDPSEVCKGNDSRYIVLGVFNFFTMGKFSPYNSSVREVNPAYIIEYPLASKNYIINKKKIIDVLYNQLNEFIEVLKIYLHCFIDNTTKVLYEKGKITTLGVMNNSDVVISFNYTNTFELFYPSVKMFHVHGNVNNRIVLGINSDQNDKEETIDTSFLMFKKYYQRTYYATDISYLRWLRGYIGPDDIGVIIEEVNLLVMGHSLDVTDENYIRELFSLASKITILYHDDNAKKQYIQNLVNIFGGYEFEQIRDKKELEFLSLNSDLSNFCKEREDNSTVAYNNRFLD